MDADLPDWLERLENKKETKSYLRKEPKPRTVKKSKPSDLYARSGQLSQSLSLMDIVADTPSSRTLRNSGLPKSKSSSKKHKKRSLSASGGKASAKASPRDSATTSLKRLADSFETPETPFLAPVWKKRRAQIQLGVDELLEYCQKAVLQLMEHVLAWPFLVPVDHVALAIPDYPLVITHPMDLGTINKKINDLEYRRLGDFIDDVRLVWNNCKRYNNETLDIHKSACILEKLFEEKLIPIHPYVEHNAPLVKSDTLQKTVNHLQLQLTKLSKQNQLQQQTQLKPKQSHYLDASPPVVLREDVSNVALLPEENIILAEDVMKLEMKYMKGLVQIVSEDAPHLLKTDSPVVEINLASLDDVTKKRVVQYLEDCRTDRRLRKNQSRRKHRENKAANAQAGNRSRPANRNRNSQGKNSESQSDNSSSMDEEDSQEDGQGSGQPREKKLKKAKDAFPRAATPTTQPLSNSGFEMGGDETPGLTDFQNSAWTINEDADSIYRYDSFESSGATTTAKPGGWDDFGNVVAAPENSTTKKKKDPDASPKPKSEKAAGEKRRPSKSAKRDKANQQNNDNAANLAAYQYGSNGYAMNPMMYSAYGAMNPMAGYYGVYGQAGKQPQSAQSMNAYQYQQYQAQYQYQYQQAQYQYQQQAYQYQQAQQQSMLLPNAGQQAASPQLPQSPTQ